MSVRGDTDGSDIGRVRTLCALSYTWRFIRTDNCSVAIYVIRQVTSFKGIHMYIGGGILGTILVVLLVVWLVRRV